jgi:hypothetical protein
MIPRKNWPQSSLFGIPRDDRPHQKRVDVHRFHSYPHDDHDFWTYLLIISPSSPSYKPSLFLARQRLHGIGVATPVFLATLIGTLIKQTAGF